ncbi:MAG: hypothetical protein KAV44_05590 [Bacteroidales bacterium]|nr:hypothetical protein [Bacteroidales bacterium]
MTHKSDWEKDNLKGKIKSQKITYYKVYDDEDNYGDYIRDRSGSVIRSYDEEGHRKKISIFDYNDKPSQIMLSGYSYCTSKFNEKTNETNESYFNIQGKHVASKIYKFLPNKLDYQWIWRFPDGDIAHKKKYTYSENGLLIKEEYFNSENEYIDGHNVDFWEHAKELSKNNDYQVDILEHRHTFILYKYNDKGLLVEETYFYIKGEKPSHKYIYVYNDYGFLIEKREYFGVCLTKERITYHEDGTRTVESLFDKDKDLWSKFLYKYNDQGLITERKKYDSNSCFKERRIYEYDEIKNLVLEERYSPQEKLLNYIEFKNAYFSF